MRSGGSISADSPRSPARSARSDTGSRAAEHAPAHPQKAGGTVGPRWILEAGLTRPDYVISAGFSCGVAIAHNGCLHLEMQVQGRQPHAAFPHTDVDALEATVGILRTLYTHGADLAQKRSGADGIASHALNVGLINGGIRSTSNLLRRTGE